MVTGSPRVTRTYIFSVIWTRLRSVSEKVFEENGRIDEEVSDKVDEETGRIDEEVSDKVDEETGRIDEEVSDKVVEETGRIDEEVSDNERTSTRLNSRHKCASRMPSPACKKNRSENTRATEQYRRRS